ncbi:hypothetical protein K3X44_10005 [Aliiroseovarius crassostreae]|nr:hypothetical protein [Aliiroseovarius crassostreae]UWQ00847.1 hypothetical protein K3X44_10005 [Aliiroseovarius crassostreae]
MTLSFDLILTWPWQWNAFAYRDETCLQIELGPLGFMALKHTKKKDNENG